MPALITGVRRDGPVPGWTLLKVKPRVWQRAKDVSRFYTEVPDTLLLEGKGVETVETGVIDLVFEEEDGWVIVDYKTGGKNRDYSKQLEAYREAWEEMGCGKVKEVGVYFVDHEEYVILGDSE